MLDREGGLVMNLEEARMALATLARQLDICAMFGKWNWHGREADSEQVKALAGHFAEAIRRILQEAGLTDDWQGGQ